MFTYLFDSRSFSFSYYIGVLKAEQSQFLLLTLAKLLPLQASSWCEG